MNITNHHTGEQKYVAKTFPSKILTYSITEKSYVAHKLGLGVHWPQCTIQITYLYSLQSFQQLWPIQ